MTEIEVSKKGATPNLDTTNENSSNSVVDGRAANGVVSNDLV